jgi:DNA-binding XRE family transcriptional regulator
MTYARPLAKSTRDADRPSAAGTLPGHLGEVGAVAQALRGRRSGQILELLALGGPLWSARLAAALGAGVADLELPPTGSPLRRFREARGWTRRELARQAGVSRDTVLHVEGGRAPVAATARKLAAALGAAAPNLSLPALPRPRAARLREVRAARGLT